MTYRATSDIFAAPGVLAYCVGDVVPDSAVKNLDIESKVEKTKDADESPRSSRSRRPKKSVSPSATTAPVPSVDPEADSADA